MNKQRFSLKGIWLCIAVVELLWAPPLAQAKYIGADPPKCPTCSCSNCKRPTVAERSDTSSSDSRTEGNLSDWFAISSIFSSTGPTLNLSAIYNSYNADGSRATVDTVMGYGFTHSYNIFLFTQLGSMFRYDGDGRVTRYALGSGGSFTAAPGYFETLVKNPDGSFTLTKKDKTVYTFKSIAGTLFLVGGPVWRLTSIVDRNGNTTTLTYTAGNLTAVTDTYGRTLTFAYNSLGHITSVTDPDGRVTKFQYDVTGQMLTTVTDPLGNTIRYTYNALYQITSKTDKAGRKFNYVYSNFEPVAVYDSSNTGPATLSNPGSWATNATLLAENQLRVYTPATTTNTDGRGNTSQYQYDTNGYLLETTAPDGSTTTYTYDPATLQLATMTDANGHTTSHTYDSMGNMLTMTDALGHVTTYTYDPTFNMMTSMRDPRGRITTYTIDATNGNLTQETDPLGNSNKWTYDSHGNVLTYTDKNGNATQYVYDAFGDRIQETDAAGTTVQSTTNFGYDAVGNLTSVTDALGRITQYQYDGMNRVTQETDAVGTPQQRTIQTFYDGEGNRIEIIDGRGITTTYQYDLRQRLITETDAVGSPQQRSTTTTYDGNDNRITVTDPLGRVTTYQYDTRNRVTMETDATGTNVQASTQTAYDAVSNIVGQTDANGHTTNYTYDQINRRSTMTDAAGDKTQYFYDSGTFTGPVTSGAVTVTCDQCGATPGSSLITEQVDPDGTASLHAGTTFFKYDALNRLVIDERKTGCFGGPTGTGCPDTITANDAVTLYTYDAVGNRLTWTEPDGNTTSYLYDAKNRLIQETNAAGDVTTTTYDLVNNVATVTAPNLNVATNTYDALNRLTDVADSVGLVATYTYDPDDNRVSQGDGNGSITLYEYDSLNRLTTATDPLGKTTTSTYDAVNNQLTVRDRNGNLTGYTYDALNRRSTMTDALGNITQWQYDLVGNLIKIIDADGNATQYTYDVVNRQVKETYADGTSRSYTYDPVGNQITRTDQIPQTTTYVYSDLYFLISRIYPVSGTDTMTYDLSGRMLSAEHEGWVDTFSYDGANRLLQTVQNGHTISYVYNIPGRTRQITYPGGRAITEHTDFRTRMDHINDAAYPASIVQYSYDLANNVLGRNYRNGTTSAFAYNANNWTTNIAHNNPAIFAQFGYGYDNEGNKQYENKTPQNPAQSEGYQYDTTYRLTNYKVGTLVGGIVPVPLTQISYHYDGVGNLCKATDTCQFNTTNEEIGLDSANITYDSKGNLLDDGTYNYIYDEENRKTAATGDTDSALVGQYQYDALGRRVQKIANPSGTPSTTVYFYDGPRVIEDQNSLGVTSATYVYGNYVDEVLTMDVGGNTYYYHQNALWSVEAITDSTATPVERYAYDGYGLVSVTNGMGTPVSPNPWGAPHSAIGNPFVFTGRELDEETGLYYYRARYYDPAKGRFQQRDPLGYVDGSNLYAYVHDRPTFGVDATGLKLQCVFEDCTDEQKKEAKRAVEAAAYDVGEAKKRLNDLINGKGLEQVRADTDKRFDTYFGHASWWTSPWEEPERRKKVLSTLEGVYDALQGRVVINCNGPQCKGDYFAYVDPKDQKEDKNLIKIYLCKQFWKIDMTSKEKESKAGTIIHEISHITANFKDTVWGRRKAQMLAKDEPNVAITNPDNYAYFVETFTKSQGK